MIRAKLAAIEYYLPEARLTNDRVAADLPKWTPEAIEKKTGIRERRLAGPDECASDLAFRAAEQVLAGVDRASIDYLLFCTQSPDYLLPTSACILQDRLGLPTHCGAIDFNLGCSGYIYGLGLAKGLIESGQARRVLLLTGETYSKYIAPGDESTRPIFGDGASASLVEAVESEGELLGPFVYGTDGSGADRLIVRGGGMREPGAAKSLEMAGPDIFTFTIKSVPPLVAATLRKAGLDAGQIDAYVFHQANEYMLEHLRKKLGIEKPRFPVVMRDCGNTVSATIPIALKDSGVTGTLLLVGFGVGYSWGACIVRI